MNTSIETQVQTPGLEIAIIRCVDKPMELPEAVQNALDSMPEEMRNALPPIPTETNHTPLYSNHIPLANIFKTYMFLSILGKESLIENFYGNRSCNFQDDSEDFTFNDQDDFINFAGNILESVEKIQNLDVVEIASLLELLENGTEYHKYLSVLMSAMDLEENVVLGATLKATNDHDVENEIDSTMIGSIYNTIKSNVSSSTLEKLNEVEKEFDIKYKSEKKDFSDFMDNIEDTKNEFMGLIPKISNIILEDQNSYTPQENESVKYQIMFR